MSGIQQRVRPGIRRLAIVACLVLLPAAAHSLWDYVEIRRLVHEIEVIRAKGEPVTTRQAPSVASPSEPTASRDYLAGAMLALPSAPSRVITPIREALAAPAPDREALRRFAAPLDALVAESADALRLADRAAALPFDGFAAGTEFNYRASGVRLLSESITARSLKASLDGAGDAAIESVLSFLQSLRADRDAGWLAASGHQVPAVLSLSRPSEPALRRLQIALEAEGRPDRALDEVVRDRTRYIELIWRRYYGTDPAFPRNYRLPMRSVAETIARPWLTHKIVGVLQVWAALVDAAGVPWPRKAQVSAAVLDRYRPEQHAPPGRFDGIGWSGYPFAVFKRAVDPTPLIVDRASAVAVAIERFRSARGTMPAALADLVPEYVTSLPVDPYTGRALLFRQAPRAYTIYSVGPNGRDDGGDLTSEFEQVIRQGFGRRVIAGADVGVRVLDLR